MRVGRGGRFWQFGSIASLATEFTDGEILVAFLTKHGLRSDLRAPYYFLGEHAPRPAYLVHTYAHAMAVPVQKSWLRP